MKHSTEISFCYKPMGMGDRTQLLGDTEKSPRPSGWLPLCTQRMWKYSVLILVHCSAWSHLGSPSFLLSNSVLQPEQGFGSILYSSETHNVKEDRRTKGIIQLLFLKNNFQEKIWSFNSQLCEQEKQILKRFTYLSSHSKTGSEPGPLINEAILGGLFNITLCVCMSHASFRSPNTPTHSGHNYSLSINIQYPFVLPSIL